MGEALTLPAGAIRQALDADPEWRLAARFWDARIRFFVGGDGYLMDIKDGQLVDFSQDAPDPDNYDILIGGPAETWAEILEEIPRPYYQSFLPAKVFHGFTCAGDIECLYTYYGAVDCILRCMRRCFNDERR
jgi:hypothetical protein